MSRHPSEELPKILSSPAWQASDISPPKDYGSLGGSLNSNNDLEDIAVFLEDSEPLGGENTDSELHSCPSCNRSLGSEDLNDVEVPSLCDGSEIQIQVSPDLTDQLLESDALKANEPMCKHCEEEARQQKISPEPLLPDYENNLPPLLLQGEENEKQAPPPPNEANDEVDVGAAAEDFYSFLAQVEKRLSIPGYLPFLNGEHQVGVQK